MTERPWPKLVKWPFFVADAVLLLLAWWIMARSTQPFVPWPMFFLVLSVIAAFAFAVLPYLLEYQAALRLSESSQLTTAVAEIGKLQLVADQIRLATSQWQTAHEHSLKSVGAAKEISERMTIEAKAFAEFMQKANDSEKGHLRLETEKLRRNEGEWMQIVVRLLDHVFALHQAGVRSAQPNVREQLTLFQNACRDVVRRIGLTPIEASADEPFDEERHQLLDPARQPEPGATISEMLATGYTFQGQLLRRALVRLKGDVVEAAAASAEAVGANPAGPGPATPPQAEDPFEPAAEASVPGSASANVESPARGASPPSAGRSGVPGAETSSEEFRLESEPRPRLGKSEP